MSQHHMEKLDQFKEPPEGIYLHMYISVFIRYCGISSCSLQYSITERSLSIGHSKLCNRMERDRHTVRSA